MKKLLLCGVAAIVLASCNDKPKVDEQEVNAALEKMALLESGDGRTEFSERALKGDEVVFTDVIINTQELAEEAAKSLEDSGEIELEGDVETSNLKADKLIFKGLKLGETGDAVFSKMTLKNMVSLKEDDLADESSLEELSLTEPTPALAAWVSGLLGKSEKVDAPKAADVGFTNLTLGGFKATSKEDDLAEFSVAKISVDDYRDFRAGKVNLSDLAVSFAGADTESQGSLTLGDFSLTGLKLDLVQAFDEEDEDAIAQKISEIAYENPVDPGFDAFSLEKLNLTTDGIEVNLPSMSYKVKRNDDGVPVEFDMPKFTMTMTADSAGGSFGAMVAPYLAMLNLDDVKLSMEGESTYDPETDISNTKTSYIEIENALKLSTTGKISGISKLGDVMKEMDPEAFADGDADSAEFAMDIYSQLDLHDFKISIEDQGVIDKAFGLAAAMQGMEDPQELRTQVIGMTAALPLFAAGMGVDMGIAAELSAAASKFLQDGGTLTLSFDPEEPISFATLMEDPSNLTKDYLGFSATVE